MLISFYFSMAIVGQDNLQNDNCFLHLIESYDNRLSVDTSYNKHDYTKAKPVIFRFNSISASLEYTDQVLNFKKAEVKRCKEDFSGGEICSVYEYDAKKWQELLQHLKSYIDENNSLPTMPIVINKK